MFDERLNNGYKKSLAIAKLLVVPLGLEPRLFCTKNRRVASYTIGQYQTYLADKVGKCNKIFISAKQFFKNKSTYRE